MGSKPFTCACVLPRDEHGDAAAVPRLAIGSADGTVRVLHGFKPDAMTAVFGAKGAAAVCAMAVVPIHDRDALITGAPSLPTAPHRGCPELATYMYIKIAPGITRHRPNITGLRVQGTSKATCTSGTRCC